MALVTAMVLGAGSADAQTRAGKIVGGVALAALGAWTLSYDPPDVTHRDFKCVRGPDLPSVWMPVRVNANCKTATDLGNLTLRTARGEFRAARGRVGVFDPLTGDDVARFVTREDDNTTYEVKRSIVQAAAGAGLIAAGAIIALWPEAPVRVDPLNSTVEVRRTIAW